MPQRTPSAEELARELVRLQKRLDALEKHAGLAHSSIENGSIDAYDDEDNLRLIIGRQWDTTQALAAMNGPPPPTPTSPFLSPVAGGLTITWDGGFINEEIVPMDFSRVEIHVSELEGFIPQPETLLGTIETPQGGTSFLSLPAVPQFVALVARSTSGTPSIPSEQSSATPLSLVDTDTIEQALATRMKVTRGTEDPVEAGTQDGELYWKIDPVTSYVLAQWKWDADAEPPEWVPEPISGVAIAPETIATAALAASSVSTDKLVAEAVTAEKLAALAVEADKIAANAVTATKIAAGAVTADKLEANMVLSKTMIAGTPGGARVELGPFGVVKYAANGTVLMDLRGATNVFSGQVVGADIVGSVIRTATSGRRIQLSDSHPETIRFYTGYSNEFMPGEVTTAGRTVTITPPAYDGFQSTPGKVVLHNQDGITLNGPVKVWDSMEVMGGTFKSIAAVNELRRIELGQSGPRVSAGRNVLRRRRYPAGYATASGTWQRTHFHNATVTYSDDDIRYVSNSPDFYFEVGVDGLYVMRALYAYGTSSGGTLRACRITHNATTVVGINGHDTTNTPTRHIQCTAIVWAEAGDRFRSEFYHNASSSLTIEGWSGADPTEFTIARVMA